jgi:hypothetical protein
MAHAWKAEPIKFKIEGEARTDSREVLDLIAKKSGLPFIATDLKSPIYERRERAQRAMIEYADSRLDPELLKTVPHFARER